MTLPEIIPLFPLPNVVFFPRMPLPLHVFEPRYRAMVRDALRGPRLIGMVLLRGGWQDDYAGRPPVFTTGTVGQMVRVEELADGRFDIVLRGLKSFHIRDERPPAHLYREARVAWRDDVDDALDGRVRDALVGLVHRYLDRLGRKPSERSTLDRDVDDAAFVNFFGQHLDLDPLERQALLEEPSTSARASRLIDVLEFRLEELLRAGPTTHGRAH
jgi:Lon protease-like protein